MSSSQVRYACNLNTKAAFSALKAPGSLTGSAWSEADGFFRDFYLVMEQHLLFQLDPTEFTWDDDAALHRGCIAQAHQRVELVTCSLLQKPLEDDIRVLHHLFGGSATHVK